MSEDRQWSMEEQRWIYPDELGHTNGAILKLAFWEALKRCEDQPYLGDVANGDEGVIDGLLSDELWEHMAAAIAELRRAAGMKP